MYMYVEGKVQAGSVPITALRNEVIFSIAVCVCVLALPPPPFVIYYAAA